LVNTANSNATGTPNDAKNKQTPAKATGLTPLPQTGEAKQTWLQVLGVGILGFATLAGLITIGRKRHDKASKPADKK
jgi:LPXTG-motif cell wall-anchored protein